MAGVLLDTNAMVWYLSGATIDPSALFSIAEAQVANELYVSPVTAWEAALAIQKRNPARRPDLLGQDAATWFRLGSRNIGARLIPIKTRISLEAARVPAVSGNGDPGDCFVIATARAKRLTIVTRDDGMIKLAARLPTYIQVIPC